ncbi:GNAT family N-acetyltransferase [Weissella ceti]|uniref:GNAT family N-acetyltransferase n=1 Tax=Weissella ceti TaxID=759620 RepID=A0ABT3E5Q6_9LACO|nr:GNAT family N-acetyltransferase [Weissella ceti]MCW0953742.1 GNAT family N-acetyltransferase [Weissella ceti]QVK11425.1 GNAT family N-acetyltransferase [Weissella ceti]
MLNIVKTAGLSQVSEDAKQIREAVFVQEQQIDPMLEFDDQDAKAIHFVGYVGPTVPVTTARIHSQGNEWHVGRVATIKEMRGQGFGHQLMAEIINTAKLQGIKSVNLGAQVHASSFYERLGFSKVGEPFLEANIEHIEMKLFL